MTSGAELEGWRLLTISGEDRRAFLQGQLTQDVTKARTDATCLAGHADAKGRLLWTGHLFAREDSLCLLVPQALAEALLGRLRMFVLRARVTVSLSDPGLFGIPEESAATLQVVPGWQLLRIPADRSRRLCIGPAAGGTGAPDITTIAAADWRLADIRSGIPAVLPETSGEFVPQMLNLDLLDGISFNKGCYTGQEIVARTHYLGRVKRRMLRFSCTCPPLAPGSPLHGERDGVGQVVSAVATAAGSEMLAVMQVEEMHAPLFADSGRTINLERLPLPYAIPEAP